VPEGGRNAVTWGVFPGQEIAQTTIIERESFLSWKVGRAWNCPVHFLTPVVGRSLFDLVRVGVTLQTGVRGTAAAGERPR
jgi:hypothetical protein